MSNKMEVSYLDLNDNEINLSPETVKKYIAPSANITNQEMAMFLKLCQHQRLNPFLREVYLIKFGSAPASMVTGKETFLKRAKRDARYQGHKCTIEGKVPDMTATAEVYVKDYQTPITCTVWYEEYVGLKRDGTPTGMWASKPRTMLQKVALVQALREAFPDTFGGLYSQEEINSVDADKLPTANIIIEETEPEQPEERVSKERNDGEYSETDDVMVKATTKSSKNTVVEDVKEMFGATEVLEKLGPDTSIVLSDEPDPLPTKTKGSVTDEYAEWILDKYRAHIESNIGLDHLEHIQETPLAHWNIEIAQSLLEIGKGLVTGKNEFDSVFDGLFIK